MISFFERIDLDSQHQKAHPQFNDRIGGIPEGAGSASVQSNDAILKAILSPLTPFTVFSHELLSTYRIYQRLQEILYDCGMEIRGRNVVGRHIVQRTAHVFNPGPDYASLRDECLQIIADFGQVVRNTDPVEDAEDVEGSLNPAGALRISGPQMGDS